MPRSAARRGRSAARPGRRSPGTGGTCWSAAGHAAPPTAPTTSPQPSPAGDLEAAIVEHFGSFDAFSAQLSTATKGVQGSGWGVLAWEPLSQRLIVEQVYDHHGNVGQGSTPILVFDAREHAYYLQYKNVGPDYVDRLWNLVNWSDVTRRFDAPRAVGNPIILAP
ncbi:Fe-Mn family superoxide dismutase [Micromonospora chalcea]|uniref:Fe-Mn family superoxide dismutase n=1 Tax=Micromonospora chalcea TaxID=1874 RepID=UPI003434ABDD